MDRRTTRASDGGTGEGGAAEEHDLLLVEAQRRGLVDVGHVLVVDLADEGLGRGAVGQHAVLGLGRAELAVLLRGACATFDAAVTVARAMPVVDACGEDAWFMNLLDIVVSSGNKTGSTSESCRPRTRGSS